MEAIAFFVEALTEALEHSWFGAYARSSTWLYPLASVLHVLGLAFLLGAIAAFDLRVLGAARRLPLDASAAFLLPIARVAFVVQLVTGFVMFAADAHHVYDNPYFVAKLVVILVALVNIVVFHLGARGDPSFWDLREPPSWAKVSAALSIVAWIAVASFGRMIAYV